MFDLCRLDLAGLREARLERVRFSGCALAGPLAAAAGLVLLEEDDEPG